MRGNKLFKLIDKYTGIFLIFYLNILSRLFGVFRARHKGVEKILVIKLSALGDTLLLLPVIRAIRSKYNDKKITGICTNVNYAVWENIPEVDFLLNLNIKKLSNPGYFFRILFFLKNQKFDMVFDFDQWLKVSALLALWTGAPKRLGFKTRGQCKHFGFTKAVAHLENIHELDMFIRLTQAGGVPVDDIKINFPVRNQDIEKIREVLKRYNLNYEKDRYIVVHPGCGEHGWRREWPPERYSEICDWIIDRYGYKAVVTGGSSEKRVVDGVIRGLKEPVINLQEKLKINEFSALLKNAEFLISGNTGIMHLAASVGTMCVALHGPTSTKKWGPLGNNHIVIKSPLECSPCLTLGFEYGCSERNCMDAISVEEVKKKIKRFANE
jgi:heptosyltransferase I